MLTDPLRGPDSLRSQAMVSIAVPPGHWPTDVCVLRAFDVAYRPEAPDRVAGARIQLSPGADAVAWEQVLTDSSARPIHPYSKYPTMRPGGFDASGLYVVFSDRSTSEASILTMAKKAQTSGIHLTDNPVGTIADGQAGTSLFLRSNPEDLVYLWRGLDWAANVVEIVIEVDRRLRDAWAEAIIPADTLNTQGIVVSSELDALGVVMDVIGPNDFPGRWLNDYSTWPEEHRPPRIERPDIAKVFRVLGPVEGTAVQLDPLDADGNRVFLGGAHTTRDGWALTCWEDRDALASVATLRLRVPLKFDR